MKSFTICLLVFCYLCFGEMREWPRHTVCKIKDLEAYYQSCDPLQDVGLSLSPCTRDLHEHINLKLGVILRHDINFLLLRLMAFYKGINIFSQEIISCDRNFQANSFCGKKKGDFVSFHHPLRIDFPHFLHGQFNISIVMSNEDDLIIICGHIFLNIM